MFMIVTLGIKAGGQEFKSSCDYVVSELETSLGYIRPSLNLCSPHAKIIHFYMEKYF